MNPNDLPDRVASRWYGYPPSRMRRIATAITYYTGVATLAILIFALAFFGCIKVDQMAHSQNLRQGYVVNKSYGDGHYWYTSWTFGDYSLTKRNGGAESYYIEVSDGSKTDFWTVGEEEWENLSVGDYVIK